MRRSLASCRRQAAVWFLAACWPIAGQPTSAAELARGGKLILTAVDDETGEPVACRIHLKNPAGKPVVVKKLPHWHDHFAFDAAVALDLHRGAYTFEVERGPEYAVTSGHFVIEDAADDRHEIRLRRQVDLAAEGWWSADLHVHRPLKHIETLMRAEDLHLAPVITWWNEKNEWAKTPPPPEPLRQFDGDRYYHVMAGEDERGGGALLYFNLPRPLDIAGAQREFPCSLRFLAQARQQPSAWIDAEKPFWWDFPLWLASGQIDSIGLANNHHCRDEMLDNEAWGKPRDRARLRGPWGNGQWSQEIYHHALNCGLRIPPSAGSASGVLPNPVGYNRMYVFVGHDFHYDAFWEALRAGRVMVTNGPLIRPLVNGKLPGHVFQGQAGETLDLEINLKLSTREPIQYVEIIKDGKVEHSVPLDRLRKGDAMPRLKFDASGWFLIRAVADVEKTYRFGSTGPYYVEFPDAPRPVSRESARFFLNWTNQRTSDLEDKLPQAEQRAEILAAWQTAREFWQAKVAAAERE